MNQRVEAAAKAEYEHEFLLLEGKWEDATPEIKECFRESVRAGVEAADAVMFSDEAVERAQAAIERAFSVDYMVGEYDATAVWGTPADIVSAVIAALKGDA